MLRFVLRKLFNKKWMAASLLIGNILLIAITSANPMYTNAVMQRMLTKNLETQLIKYNQYPATVTVTVGGMSAKNNSQIEDVRPVDEKLAERLEVEEVQHVQLYATTLMRMEPTVDRGGDNSYALTLMSLANFEEHAAIISGRMPSKEVQNGNVIEVAVSQNCLVENDLLLNERLRLNVVSEKLGEDYYAEIVGIYGADSSEDIYWVKSPNSYSAHLVMQEECFEELFINNEQTSMPITVTWYSMLNYQQITSGRASEIIDELISFKEDITGNTGRTYQDNFTVTLENHIKQVRQVRITFWVLQVPVFVLLAAFIFMVSRQMLEMEENEISVLKSRGANRFTILRIYGIQSFVMTALGISIGLPLGAFLCKALGSTNAFLEFVQRKSLNAKIDTEVLMYAVGAAVLSILAMLLPVLRVSKVNIVAHKRSKNKKNNNPVWQKMFLDFICLGVALYGLFNFNNQKAFLAQQVAEGASVDPLLFLSSSLFILGSGLLALRVIPLLIWLIFKLFEKKWSPALYASFLRVLRTRSSQSFITVFLVITIALGVFNAQAARTINANNEDGIRYLTGADVVLKEAWNSTSEGTAENKSPFPIETEVTYTEPDFTIYPQMDGVESAAKVFTTTKAGVSIPGSGVSIQGGKYLSIQVMGIETDDFGRTAYFDTELLPQHWYNYLNALALNTNGVLVSKNAQKNYNLKIGDTITFSNSAGTTIKGIIYGFVDYWPSYSSSVYIRGNDGKMTLTDNYLIVANLSRLQASWGIQPYEIWLKTKDGSKFIYDYAEESGKRFQTFEDADALVVESLNDPILQGTNGILTVGFIVALMLCTVGFLIFWILSIQSRTLQFGIFRAMGMTMREIITMLLNEQFYISALSIAAGGGIGYLAGRLYMPLIQMAYSSAENTLPLIVQTSTADMIRLFGVVAVVMLVCMMILTALIRKMKIAQALKLGED